VRQSLQRQPEAAIDGGGFGQSSNADTGHPFIGLWDDEKDIMIEGMSRKRFAVYRFNRRGEPSEQIAEYDTIEEVRNHHWRFDWDQRVRLQRGECWKYLSMSKFEEWAKGQR